MKEAKRELKLYTKKHLFNTHTKGIMEEKMKKIDIRLLKKHNKMATSWAEFCPPPNSCVEAVTSSISKCDCIRRYVLKRTD